ncbi:MAG: hypothetical protein AB9869_09255 [Verrucomicrobiia bacterium]
MVKSLIQNFSTAWKFPRWRWALVTAVLSDSVGLGMVMIPPLHWALDALTAVVLLVVLGFRWSLLGALAIEAVPALQIFPAWTLVVASLAATEKQECASVAERLVPETQFNPTQQFPKENP